MTAKIRSRIMMNKELRAVKLPANDWSALNELVYYGAIPTAQREYEFIPPTYDEDAGISTDYGQNQYARTFANIYMTQLLSQVIQDVDFRSLQDLTAEEYEANSNPEIEGLLLNMAIPALNHLLITCMDKEHQKSIWMRKIRDSWESDGHYGTQSRQEYIDSELTRLMLDNKRIRRINDVLQDLHQGRTLNFQELLTNSEEIK